MARGGKLAALPPVLVNADISGRKRVSAACACMWAHACALILCLAAV